jgi:PhzF family phenazine biosynthesis protein
MSRLRAFRQVDVFATTPYSGNPVAVVLDGDGLSTEEMQRFARWTNLSETTFLLPARDGPVADYRVRIFTTAEELPFAGHPTLGTCHAWLEHGGVPRSEDRIVQECEAGLVTIAHTDAGLSFAAPPLVRGGPVDAETAAEVTSALGIDPSAVVDLVWADNGPGWVAVLLESADAVLAVRPSYSELAIGVVGPHPGGSAAAYEVRAFFPKDGAPTEDPVTGSLNASLGQWLLATRRATAPYVARQGTAIGRAGRVHVTQDADGSVWVGGATTTSIAGSAAL